MGRHVTGRMTQAGTSRETAQRVTECRSCGAALPAPFLDLGSTPVANRLLTSADQAEERYPLAVSHCPACALVQLAYALPAEALFDEDYPYYSSVSDALVRHSREHVDELVLERGLSASSLVVELASNDGYLLKGFVDQHIPVLGVEPTSGPAAAARQVDVPTMQAFFGRSLAEHIVQGQGKADVVIANNVMAHVPELNDFVSGIANLLSDQGVATIENPSVVDLIEHSEFDTIYHEHFCYFSCTAVDALMRRHGLALFRIEHFPNLHGGTLRWWVAPTAASIEPEGSVHEHLDRERRLGVPQADYYAGFGAAVRGLQGRLRDLLTLLKTSGKSIAGYGAAAKGATLLNSAGIGPELIDFVVDRSVHKQGKWLPGARLPILPVEALLERRPSVALLLAWNFAAEIVEQQQAYRKGGGQFIVPVPEPRLIE